eukprot:COSAG02_NODE_58694_length_276_cov_1.146893_1_plen_52_part_10
MLSQHRYWYPDWYLGRDVDFEGIPSRIWISRVTAQARPVVVVAAAAVLHICW